MENNISEKILPIGTVCLLKNATKKVMITGFFVKANNEKTMYDYSGCLYPEGILSSNQNLLFNHDQIEKVFFMGYEDSEEALFKIKLKELKEKNETSQTENI